MSMPIAINFVSSSLFLLTTIRCHSHFLCRSLV
ncbi:hypothetical protein GLYMA_08G354150v4 [Glycine max]|nr:hypothetical protein GLYMA_08G354150v4 [Glycine max]